MVTRTSSKTNISIFCMESAYQHSRNKMGINGLVV